MTKKTIVTFAVLVVCAAGLLYVLKTGILIKSKYTLNGTIARCTIKETPMYQYIPNTERPLPQHFNYSGKFIPCEFKNQIPTAGCKLLLSSLKNCRVIYRTDKNIQSLSGVYAVGAAQAIKTLKDKIH